MATTNSTNKDLNYFHVESTETNSNVEDYIYTNTGNMERKNGLNVLNNTYTCETGENAIINVKLLNYKDSIYKQGSDVSSVLVADQEYEIIGHPDKWIYDHRQGYNNCGVDSALNVLSIAGAQEIIQRDTEYQQYLDTPIITKKIVTEYDEEKLEYVQKEVIETTYPVAKNNTEDEFLLWAVQNSHNDEKWYDDFYENVGDVDLPTGVELKDFCLHSKNDYEYKKIEDLQGSPDEIGGTTARHRDNILEYYGIASDYKVTDIKKVAQTNADITEVGEAVIEDWGAGEQKGKKVTTVTTVTSKDFLTTTTTTEIVYYEDTEMQTKHHTEKIVTVENKLATEWYNFIDTFENLITDGKGVILAGSATENYNGEPNEGEAHAITLLGLVKGDIVKKETNVYINDELQGQSTIREDARDVVGFYVMDTGGWLGNNEGATFVTVKQLYNFLTNGNYVDSPETEEYVGKYINYTEENIRDWSFALDLKGNDRKNILKGNDSKNKIYGGKGNDVIYGNAGDDEIYGEGDQDTIMGGAGDDILDGGADSDTYIFKASDRSNNDTIIAGNGQDKIQFDNTRVTFLDENGNAIRYERHTIQSIMDVTDPVTGDVIEKGMKYQNILGDLVIAYTSKIEEVDINDNVLSTETFSNTLTIKDYFKKGLYTSVQFITEASGAYIDGKDVDYTGFEYKSYNFFEDFVENKGYINYFVYENKDNKITGSQHRDSIVGGNKNDSLSGGNGNDIINGGYGNDTIKAGNGNDEIYASYGNDKIYGDAGDDTFYYNNAAKYFGGDDTIYAGKGNDYIYMDNLTKDDLLFTKQGNNLVITYNKTTGDTITIASYFSKKGNMSIKGIELKDNKTLSFYHDYKEILAKVNENPALVVNDSKNTTDATLNGGISHDKITAGKGNDIINGGVGFDTLYGGNGNDTLVGGGDSDKMYGQAGDNTYKFALADGHDTIYTSGKGTTTLDFTGTGLTFNEELVTGFLNDHIYTKVKNDLLINYAKTNAEDGNATVQISNYFSSANNFTLKWGDAENQSLNLKDVYIYMNGDDLKKNSITGSKYNDSIVGYDFDDVLKGGAGNDIIEAGKGNDKITGGTGNNVITYNKGDGNDTIYLTKNENLTIDLNGFNMKDLSIDIVKNDLVISEVTTKNEIETLTPLLTLKSFGKSDVTGVNGSVVLDVNGTKLDLREGYYLDVYDSFTSKKYKYNGSWHTEVIDGRKLNLEQFLKKGINVNAGAGHDTIYGTMYNDTINGGNGNDVIYTDYGKNTANGGNGKDTYHIFNFDKDGYLINETTTIKDSGKSYEKSGEIDKIVIDAKKEDIVYTSGNIHNEGSIWFNITNKGKVTYTLNIQDGNGNTVKATGVEKVITTEGTESTADDKQFNFYNNNKLIEDVAKWLTDNSYKDVSTVLSKGHPDDAKALLAIFANEEYWGAVTDTI